MNYIMDGFLYAQDRAHIIPVHLVRMKNFIHTYYYTEYKFVEKSIIFKETLYTESKMFNTLQ